MDNTSMNELEILLAKNNINIISVVPCDFNDNGIPTNIAVAYEYQWRLPNGATKWQKMVKVHMFEDSCVENDLRLVYRDILSDVSKARRELER